MESIQDVPTTQTTITICGDKTMNKSREYAQMIYNSFQINIPTVMSDTPHTQHAITAPYKNKIIGLLIQGSCTLYMCVCVCVCVCVLLTLSVRLEVTRGFAWPSLRDQSLMDALLVPSLAMLTMHTYSIPPQWTVSAANTLHRVYKLSIKIEH